MVTRIGDDIPERPVYRDALGITVYGGKNGRNYTFKAINGYETELLFQTKKCIPIKIDGLTNEVLLATIIDRLTLQNDNMPCRENQRALDNLKDALSFLESRSFNKTIQLTTTTREDDSSFSPDYLG